MLDLATSAALVVPVALAAVAYAARRRDGSSALTAARAFGLTRGRSIALTLGRHQVGALVATCVDFAMMTLLVEAGLASPVPATLAGASVGAVTNFMLGRLWVFDARTGPAAPQAVRYGVVAAASAGLNALGELLMHERLGVHYVAARVVVAIAVSVAWNFPLQRYFVFRAPPSE